MVDKHKQILLLSPYYEGKRQDFSIFKNMFKQTDFPEKKLWVDLGFLGIADFLANTSIKIPYKKPKGTELSAEQKQKNSILSRIRVVVENSIAMLKRYFILRIENRMYQKKKLDDAVELCAFLWNFKKSLKC